jgi:hypothetical protein
MIPKGVILTEIRPAEGPALLDELFETILTEGQDSLIQQG